MKFSDDQMQQLEGLLDTKLDSVRRDVSSLKIDMNGVKTDLKKIKEDLSYTVDFLDRADIELRGRVDRIESVLKLPKIS